MSDGDLSRQEAMSLARQAGVEEMACFVIGYMSGRGIARDFIKSTVVEYCKKISSLSATQSQKEELYLLLIDMNLGNLKERMSKLRPASILIDPSAGKEVQNIDYNPGPKLNPIIPDIKPVDAKSINTVHRYAYESRGDNISQNMYNPEELKQDIKDPKEVPPDLISTEGIKGLINPPPNTLEFVNKVAGSILEVMKKEPEKDLKDNIIDRLKSLQREPDIGKYEEKPKSHAYRVSPDVPSQSFIQHKPENMNPQLNLLHSPDSQRSVQDIKLPQQGSLSDQYYKVVHPPIQEYKLVIPDQGPQEFSSKPNPDLQFVDPGNFGLAYGKAHQENPIHAKDQGYQVYIPDAELPAKRQSEHDLDQNYTGSIKVPQEIQYKMQNEALQFYKKDQDQPAKRLSELSQEIGSNEHSVQTGPRLTYIPNKYGTEANPAHNQGNQSEMQGQGLQYKIQPHQFSAMNYPDQQAVSPEKLKSYEMEYSNPPYHNQGQGYYQIQAEHPKNEGAQANPVMYNISYRDINYSKDHDQINLRGPKQIDAQDFSKMYQPNQYDEKAGQGHSNPKPEEKQGFNPSYPEAYGLPSNSPSEKQYKLDMSQFASASNYGGKQSENNPLNQYDISSFNSGLYNQSPQKFDLQSPSQSPHQQLPLQLPQQSPHQQVPLQSPNQQLPQQVSHQQVPYQQVPLQSSQQLPLQVPQQEPYQQVPQQLLYHQVPHQPPYQDIYPDQFYSSQSQLYFEAPNLSQHSAYQGAQPHASNPEMQYGQFTFNQHYHLSGAPSPNQQPKCCLCQNYSDTSVISVCRQNHTTHLNCIVNMAVNDLNRNTIPTKCPYPQCTAELETFNFYNNLPKDIAEKLDMLAAQQIYDLNGEVLVRTPCLRCMTLIEHDKSNTCLECRTCKFSFCTKCNRQSHPGSLCT